MSHSAPLSDRASHLWYKLSGARRRDQAAAKKQFYASLSRLKRHDVVFDLGANVGEFTSKLADTGAKVYAFEPDPHAHALLCEAMKGRENVSVIAAAVGDKPGTAQLYRKTSFEREPKRATKSSSLFAEKRNVSAEDMVEVQVVSLTGFLTALSTDVKLIKMDIEGAEVPVLEALLDDPIASRVGEIYVETHERALPHLADRTAALKTKAAQIPAPRINWDWH